MTLPAGAAVPPGQPSAGPYPPRLTRPAVYAARAVPGGLRCRLRLPASAPGAPAVVYPARLSGYLDPNLSRWMWLVKWFLAIPHFIVLFFLWFAFGVVTIVAWFAILFTGRYPRSLFNFNVGVIRWSWRVAFYAYSALGTDLYPPFTLDRTDYPADFDVDYPEKLSRGLVLVKSWLLALPHLLIIALLTGTAQTWVYRDGDGCSWARASPSWGCWSSSPGSSCCSRARYSPGALRLPDGPEPLDLPRHRLRCADAGRISAVPSGYGSGRSGRAAGACIRRTRARIRDRPRTRRSWTSHRTRGRTDRTLRRTRTRASRRTRRRARNRRTSRRTRRAAQKLMQRCARSSCHPPPQEHS